MPAPLFTVLHPATRDFFNESTSGFVFCFPIGRHGPESDFVGLGLYFVRSFSSCIFLPASWSATCSTHNADQRRQGKQDKQDASAVVEKTAQSRDFHQESRHPQSRVP